MKTKWFLWLSVICFIVVAQSLILPIAMGAVLAMVLWGPYVYLTNKGAKPFISASLLTIGFTLLFLIPLGVLSIMGVRGLIRKLPEIKAIGTQTVGLSMANSPLISKTQGFLQKWFGIAPNDLANSLQDYAESIGSWLAVHVGEWFTNVPQLSLAFTFTLVGLFFFLLEGDKVLNRLYSLKLLPDDEMSLMFQKVSAISRALILASLAIALSQSLIYSIGCILAGASNIVIIGFLVFFTSFVPVVGSVPITFGVALYYLSFQGSFEGIILLIAAALTTVTDNIIRPWFLKGGANLHPLLAFLGVFGGIQTMGVFGIFLGPVVAGIFATSIEILSQRR